MTPNEIYRTAHKYIPKEQWKSTLFLRPDRDPNEMCISCKNEQTGVVGRTLYLIGCGTTQRICTDGRNTLLRLSSNREQP